MLILRWLAEQALKGRELLSFLFVVVASIWVSSAPPRVQLALRSSLSGSILFPVQAGIEMFRVRVGLDRQLARLREENARLVMENRKLAEIADMRSDLREFEPVRPNLEFPIVGARVVSRDPLRLGGTWIIDRGIEAGIQEGMAVATASGLVGRILNGATGHSLMQSLSDPDCKVAVVSTRSRNPGILHSTDGSATYVEFSVTSDIRAGDSLVTWGAGGIFPRGIPVGRVTEVRRTPANVLRNARVAPFQDPWDVRDVFVLLRPPQMRVLPDSSTLQATRRWK